VSPHSPAAAVRAPRSATIDAEATRSPVSTYRSRSAPLSGSALDETQEAVAVRLEDVRLYGAEAAVAAALYRDRGAYDPEPVGRAMGLVSFAAAVLWTHLHRRGYRFPWEPPASDSITASAAVGPIVPAPAGHLDAHGDEAHIDPRVGEGRRSE
jgi:hypothetical protein